MAVVVVGAGITSAVGLSAAETSASVRAGTMRFVESDIRDKRFEPFTLATVPDDALPPLDADGERAPLAGRTRRMLRLAARALKECIAVLPRGETATYPLSLALPEDAAGRAAPSSRFAADLARLVGRVVDAERTDASHTGRAGGVVAVGQAVLAVQQGIAELALAGGVDCYRDLLTLGQLDAESRVKSASNLDGFVPGEGAAFLLVASDDAARRRGLPVLATLSPVAIGYEAGHLYSDEPYRGDGLAQTFAQLGAALPAPVADVYSSMNGESHWAKEWGVGFLRNRALFAEAHRIHHPADSLGDVGAAAGPLMIALAALGIRGGWRRSPALVYGSSDRGLRAAMLVTD